MKVEKRDGRIVDFDDSKIENAIHSAFESQGKNTGPVAGLTNEVVRIIRERDVDTINIEQIQDIVEDTLMLRGYTDVARAYIKYRERHREERLLLQKMGVVDDLDFGANAATVLKRYLIKDEDGEPTETPSELFKRVASAVAGIEKKFDSDADVEQYEQLFYSMMANLEFMPNSPTLFNAGTPLGQCSACFVLPIQDSMESIFDTLKHMALVQKSGGGTGFSFSRLRQKGATVGSTGGVASGPVSFMRIYNAATDTIKQGGCISADSLVPSSAGIRRMGSITNGPLTEERPIQELILGRDGYKHAFIAVNNGPSSVNRIQTELGYSLDATHNHLIRVLDSTGIKWKSIGDLKIGDWVVIKRGGYSGEDSPLPKCPEQHFNATPVELPSEMNTELGEILGYFVGDGCLSLLNDKKSRMVFSVSHETPDIAEWIEDYFTTIGLTPYREQKENDASWTVGVRSVTLGEWWIEAGFDKNGSIKAKIPERIFTSSKHTVCGFIRGLFEADGSVSLYGYPRLYSTSSTLISQVQSLLLSLGIVSRHSVNEDRSEAYGDNPLHCLAISHRPSVELFADLVGFKSELKKTQFHRRIEKATGSSSDPIPFAGDLFSRYYNPPGKGCAKNREPRSSNPKLNKEIGRYIRGERNPHRQRIEDIIDEMPELSEMVSDEVLRDDFIYTKIVDIDSHNVRTGEIEVEGSEFVANGFLVHNRRRGANMGILRCDHPDIMDFISCKSDRNSFQNFNISVAVTDEFMKALEVDGDIDLVSPHTGEVVKPMSARAIFDSICHNAWNSGDPGIVFIDQINRDHPLEGMEIESTNPCGEQPLLPYESCVLGSINLSNMVEDGEINWDRLEEVAKLGVRFLDNIITLNKYPIEEIEKTTKANRKIGLGVMGWAELLIDLGVPYDSEEALELADKVMSFIRQKAERASAELAKIRGNFENFAYLKERNTWKRNAALITIAPTGSISLISQTSSGIEPLFAITHRRILAEGTELVEVNEKFKQVAKERGFWSDELEKEIAKTGTVQNMEEVPDDIKRIFKTAHEIKPEWHVRMQAAFQQHVDNAVSKTVNLPNSATTDDVEDVYRLAHELDLKGITVFRDGCLENQVLYAGGCSTCEV